MNVHFDFSIFLLDGSAFGKAACDVALARVPKQGDILFIGDLMSRAPQTVSREAVAFAESKLGQLTVNSLTTLAAESSGPRFLAEIDDVVLDSRPTAIRLISVLESLGFDCDIWANKNEP